MGRPRTYDEDRVLDDAVALFRERGFDRTSIPQLIDKLGICRQALYSTFGDKRGLYLRALDRWARDEIDTKVALLTSPGSPLENARTLVRSLASFATSCPSEGCLTVSSIVQTHDDPDARAAVEEHVQRLEQALIDCLTRAQDLQELRPDAHPERLARTTIVALYGIGLLCRLPSSAPRIRDTVSTLLATLDAAAAQH